MPMPPVVRKRSLIPRLGALGVALCLLLGVGASAAQATGIAGILPPRNPASDCDRANAAAGDWGVANIDSCRALEGVGPLTLPTNWNTLTTVEQGFVLIDLERVNRGLAPILGLSPALSRLASAGAANGDDPAFPAGGFMGGGAIWAGAGSVLAADYLWMYDDGPNGFNSNLACPAAGAPGCWGHRDIILWDRSGGPLVAGGGYAGSGGNGSFAYLVLSGYSTGGLSFTWSGELRYFATTPTVEHTGSAANATWRHRHRPAAAARPQHRRRGAKPRPRKRLKRVTHPRHARHGTRRHRAPGDSGPTISFG